MGHGPIVPLSSARETATMMQLPDVALALIRLFLAAAVLSLTIMLGSLFAIGMIASGM